jgi:Polyketide cyclase / dehydrase and lipid transport
MSQRLAMTDEIVSATATISASAEAVFAVLADPSRHAAIDGTGRVRDDLDGQLLTGSGQIFRVDMYHENHPDGSYQIANQVLAFDPPRVISWRPGYVSPATGKLEFGGWIWRYDLRPLGPDTTEVTLSYDWSAVGPVPRQHISFPPFAADHLDNSLGHLAAIVAR